MKIIYFFIICTLVFSCAKNDGINGNDTISIDDLQKSFYQQNPEANNPYYLNQSYKTSINWGNVVESNDWSVYVKVSSSDTLNVLSSLRLENYLWLKAKKADKEWLFSFIAFIPENVDSPNSFSGTIVTTYLPSKEISLESYNSYGPGFSKLAPRLPQREDCVYGYVNGQPNTIYCGPGSNGNSDYDKWLKGNPKDYINTNPPKGNGGSVGGVSKAILIRNFNNRIDESSLPDCMKSTLSDLKKLNGNTVADIINKFAGEVPGYNLNFATIFDGNIGRTAWVDPVIKDGYVTIKFNSNRDLLNNVTDLANATTILHESIHGYLIAWANSNDKGSAQLEYPELFGRYLKLNKKVDQNSLQHEIFVKDFINDIAKSIEQFGKLRGYDLPSSYYQDLAWKGLEGTSAFKNMDENNKLRIINIIKSEQYGIIKEGFDQKGKKLGC